MKAAVRRTPRSAAAGALLLGFRSGRGEGRLTPELPEAFSTSGTPSFFFTEALP